MQINFSYIGDAFEPPVASTNAPLQPDIEGGYGQSIIDKTINSVSYSFQDGVVTISLVKEFTVPRIS